MRIEKADIVISAVRRSQYPNDNKPEFLLVGRSNVGKSSFINTIANRKNLAYVSSNPGKTQTLNFYLFNNDFYFVDVPGYGYAETSKETRQKFGLMIEDYLEHRENLKRVFMLVDFRIKPTEDDTLMYKFLKYYKIPVTIVATKLDKVSNNKRASNSKVILATLDLEVGDNVAFFSNVTKEGKDVVLKVIDKELNPKIDEII